VRRAYPKLSVVRQPDVVALLSVGSAAAPKDVLQIGDAGSKQLVALKEEGEKGLSAFFEKDKSVAAGVLGPNGLPPLPVSRHLKGKSYTMPAREEQAYPEKYVININALLRSIYADKIPGTLAECSSRHEGTDEEGSWRFYGLYIAKSSIDISTEFSLSSVESFLGPCVVCNVGVKLLISLAEFAS